MELSLQNSHWRTSSIQYMPLKIIDTWCQLENCNNNLIILSTHGFSQNPLSSRNMTLFYGTSWPRENVVLKRVSVLEQNRGKLKTRCNSSDAFGWLLLMFCVKNLRVRFFYAALTNHVDHIFQPSTRHVWNIQPDGKPEIKGILSKL